MRAQPDKRHEGTGCARAVRVCPFALQACRRFHELLATNLEQASGADLKAMAAQTIDHDMDIKSCTQQVKKSEGVARLCEFASKLQEWATGRDNPFATFSLRF